MSGNNEVENSEGEDSVPNNDDNTMSGNNDEENFEGEDSVSNNDNTNFTTNLTYGDPM